MKVKCFFGCILAVFTIVFCAITVSSNVSVNRVLIVEKHPSNEIVHISISDNETINATPEHPFYVPAKGWTSALNLRAGDVLYTLNGEYVVVEQIEHEILENPVWVYNFEVADDHTYFVGENAVGVHNECGDVLFDDRNLQHEFSKHAKNFGIDGDWNKSNSKLFRDKLLDHIDNSTDIIKGTYRGTINVTHYYNSKTNVLVMISSNGQFIGGWKLSFSQIENLFRGNHNIQ